MQKLVQMVYNPSALTGWLGLFLLLLCYVLLISERTKKYFIPVNVVASTLLTIHAYMIHDTVFMIVNGFIAIILLYKVATKKTEI